MNRMPRFYHLADSAEVDWILRRLAKSHRGPLVVVGVSLGGNVLLRWLGERRGGADRIRSRGEHIGRIGHIRYAARRTERDARPVAANKRRLSRFR